MPTGLTRCSLPFDVQMSKNQMMMILNSLWIYFGWFVYESKCLSDTIYQSVQVNMKAFREYWSIKMTFNINQPPHWMEFWCPWPLWYLRWFAVSWLERFICISLPVFCFLYLNVLYSNRGGEVHMCEYSNVHKVRLIVSKFQAADLFRWIRRHFRSSSRCRAQYAAFMYFW